LFAMPSLADRLRAARIAAGFTTAAEAARAVGVPEPSYTAHENGSRGFKTERAMIYARRFAVPLEWLLTGRGNPPGGDRTPKLTEDSETICFKRLAGSIQAGAWQEPMPEDVEVLQIPTPTARITPGTDQYWLDITGDDLDHFVTPGGRLFCTAAEDWARDGADLMRRAVGKLLIIEARRADGTFQRICRQLRAGQRGERALHIASNALRWKNAAPISVSAAGTLERGEIVAVVTDILTLAP